jgi:NAD(P)H dehydrogenase (quinone)
MLAASWIIWLTYRVETPGGTLSRPSDKDQGLSDMAIIVTGATGAFGLAAAKLLLEKIPASELILTTRKPEQLAKFAALGVSVRKADFDYPDTLGPAFAGGTKMLLISTARVGTRVSQHENAIKAAVKAGVGHIVYTSVMGAAEDSNPAIVKLDHRATEKIIEASGAKWTFLRDSQYSEAVAMAVVPPALAMGFLPSNAHDTPIAFVSRDDCVASAVGALTSPGHENKAYDITGPELLNFPKAVAMAAEMAATPIDFRRVNDAEMFAYFDSLGIPRHASDDATAGPIPWCSEDMVTFGQSIREGYFNVLSDNVEMLTGHKPRPLRDVLKQYQHTWPTAKK